MFGKDRVDKKQEKIERELQAFQEKYGLTGLEEVDVKILRQIMLDLAGTGGLLGQISTLGFRPAEMQITNALWTITRQNWLIMRQLQKLNAKLDQVEASSGTHTD